MKLISFTKQFNIFDLINFLKNKLISIIYFKKRRLIRYSFQSDIYLKKYFPHYLNIEEIRHIFFDKQLFAYSNLNEKPKIIEILKQNCTIKSKNYIEYADKIIRKEFLIFEKEYKFKNKINWNFSFFNNFYWMILLFHRNLIKTF